MEKRELARESYRKANVEEQVEKMRKNKNTITERTMVKKGMSILRQRQ